MISRRELRKQAMRQGVALGALEKDYVLALVLERLYEPQELWTRPDILRRLWNDDLRQLLSDVPPFEQVFPQLRALFEAKLPETL